jgi:hypothetical protein
MDPPLKNRNGESLPINTPLTNPYHTLTSLLPLIPRVLSIIKKLSNYGIDLWNLRIPLKGEDQVRIDPQHPLCFIKGIHADILSL